MRGIVLVGTGAGDDSLAGEGGDDDVIGDGGVHVAVAEKITGPGGEAAMLRGVLGRIELVEENDPASPAAHDRVAGDVGDDDLLGDSGVGVAVTLTRSGPPGTDITGVGDRITLDAEAGHDTLTGTTGSDRLIGDNGVWATIAADSPGELPPAAPLIEGAVFLQGDAGNDTLQGADFLVGDNAVALPGQQNDITLRGTAGDDTLTGGGGRDVLAGDNYVRGTGHESLLAGRTTLVAAAGNDSLVAGEAADICSATT